MPRFNFSQYIAKQSLTELEQLNPQAEWEATRIEDAHATQNEVSDFPPPPSSPLFNENGGRQPYKSKINMESPLKDCCAESNRNYETAAEDSAFQSFSPSSESRFNEQDIKDEFKTQHAPLTSTPVTSRPSSPIPPSEFSCEGETNAEKDLKLPMVPQQSCVLYNNAVSIPRGLVMVFNEQGALCPVLEGKEANNVLEHLATRDIPFVDRRVKELLKRFEATPVATVGHYLTFGEYLRSLYEKKYMFDVVISVEDRDIEAHKIALSCFSSFFEAMFAKKRTISSNPFRLRLRGISGDTFEKFIKFIYTGDICVNSQDIGRYIVMAEYLDIPLLKHICADFLDSIRIDQIIQVLKGAKEAADSDLFKFAISVFGKNAATVKKCDAFLKFDVNTLCVILSHDSLAVSSEMQAFELALHWFAYDMTNRRKYAKKVLSNIRFCYMNQSELFSCLEKTDLIKGSQELMATVLQASWIISARNLNRDDPLNLEIHWKPRESFQEDFPRRFSSAFYSLSSFDGNPSSQDPSAVWESSQMYNTAVESPCNNQKQDFIAIGGFQEFKTAKDNRTVRTILRYNHTDNSWQPFLSLPEARFHHAALVVKGQLYVIGGSDPSLSPKLSIATRTCFVYDFGSEKWIRMSPMQSARMHLTICHVNGKLFAIGGQNEQGKVLKTVECYSIKQKAWTRLRPMTTARYGASSAALNGKVLVVGGYGETDDVPGIPVLKSVEMYNPKTNTWQHCVDLRIPRCFSSMINVNGVLYLCGGATRSFTTKESVLMSIPDVDVWNAQQNVWEHKTNLLTPRHHAGACVSDGKIYIVGGVSTTITKLLSSVECYDVTKDTWVNETKSLPWPARWLSCATIPGN